MERWHGVRLQGHYNTAITNLNLSKNDLCAVGAVDNDGEKLVRHSVAAVAAVALPPN